MYIGKYTSCMSLGLTWPEAEIEQLLSANFQSIHHFIKKVKNFQVLTLSLKVHFHVGFELGFIEGTNQPAQDTCAFWMLGQRSLQELVSRWAPSPTTQLLMPSATCNPCVTVDGHPSPTKANCSCHLLFKKIFYLNSVSLTYAVLLVSEVEFTDSSIAYNTQCPLLPAFSLMPVT